MGRDEHRKKKNKQLQQTPKQQIRDEMDVEFSDEFAEVADREAKVRSRTARKRNNTM